MDQSDCSKCFVTKTGVLADWKHRSKNWQHRYCCSMYWVGSVVDLELSAQYLCCQFLSGAFSPPRLQFLLGNILSNCFAPCFLFSHKDFIKYLSSLFSAKSHHWHISINWRHNYVINNKEYVTNRWTILNIYNQYSFIYKCWNFCANRSIWLEVTKENKRGCFFLNTVYFIPKIFWKFSPVDTSNVKTGFCGICSIMDDGITCGM